MKTKREFFMYSLLEFKDIEKRLERRALEGWRLKKIGFFWTYEESEPKQVHYSIVFFPKTNALEPEPSDSLVMMREYCERTGWKLVAEQGQMQVFCNEEANPVPIETEAWIQVKNIHETMKKGIVLTHCILLVNAILQLGLQAMQFFTNPVEWLNMGFNFYMIFTWIFLGIHSTVEIIHYYAWYKKAKKIAEEEEILYLPKSINGFRITCLTIAMAALFLAVLALMDFTTDKYGLLVLVWTVVIIGVPVGASRLLKRLKVSAKMNRVIIVLLSIICTVAMTAVIFMSVDHDIDIISGRSDEMVLHISDFREVNEDELHGYPRKKESVFLFCEEGYQAEPWVEGEDVSTRLSLNYTFFVVKLPILYDFVKEELIADNMKYVDVEFGDQGGYRKVDMPIWEAVEVYQDHNFEGEPQHEYLVCYPDRMIQIDFGWEVTDEDIEKVKKAIFRNKLTLATH